MWKKLLIMFVTVMGSITAGYVFYNFSIQAAPATSVYYSVGDTFERTGKTSFEMGGMNWKIFYTTLSLNL